jgi:hypothetical protein
VFEDLRSSLSDLFAARLSPTDRRSALASMKEGLVHARMALDDMRRALETSRAALAAEERELATVERRKGLAEQIGDRETVAIAERFALQHAEHVAVLRDKVEVQARELALTEGEYAAMREEFKRVQAGLDPRGAGAGGPAARSAERAAEDEVDALLGERPRAAGADVDADAFDALSRTAHRAQQAAQVDARLAALKARMGRGE